MNYSRHRIDKTSAVPVYFQIAEAIRWQIATGHYRAGERLPSTREAAAAWQVNRHTVRRAWQELVSRGVVESQGTSRMIVARTLDNSADKTRLNAFLDRVRRQANERFSLTPGELGQLLGTGNSREHLTLVECNSYQCFDLKRQLEKRFDVRVREFLLSADGQPESGPIIGTLFHSHEICARWPDRRNEMQFGGLYVNQAMADRLARACMDRKRPRKVVVYSRRHETDAFNLATDLEIALASQSLSVRPSEGKDDIRELISGGYVVAIAPWNWDSIAERDRSHPRCFLLQYIFDPVDVESFGVSFELRTRPQLSPRTEDH